MRQLTDKRVADTGHQRAANLRQRLLSASRALNTAIVNGLHARGFDDLRSTHTALLSNLDLEGSSISNVALRAGMTKQAMGRLVDELIPLGYIKSSRDKTDRRVVNLVFTNAGLDLMKQSFAVMREIEKRCAKRIGQDKLQQLLYSLSEIAVEFDDL